MSKPVKKGPAMGLPLGCGADNANELGIEERISSSVTYHKTKRVAKSTGTVAYKIMRSTGKAAWIAGTTFLILVVPAIIALEQDAMIAELESQQTDLLGAPPRP